MALTWQEVAKTKQFRDLSVEDKQVASNQYFQQVVMPKLGKQHDIKNPSILARAYTQFQEEAVNPTLVAPPNEFIKSAVNKWQEQSSGGIVDTEEGTDWAGNLVGALAGGATNVGTGALIGAGIGSIVPVIGTAIGATVGGTIGAVAGGFGQSLRETQNAGKPFSELTAGDYGRAIIEGGINAVPVAGVGGKALTKLATGALFDAGLNAGASVVGQAIQKGEVDGMEVLQQGAFGAGGHLAGGIIQQQLGKRMAKAEAQAQAEQALQGMDASQVGVLPEGMAQPQADLSEVLPYDDTPFDVNAFTQDRTTQVQTDLQAKVQEAVSLKAQGGHNQAKLIRTSLSKEMNTLAKNGDPLASTYAQALDEIDNQAKALKQKKNAPLDETAVLPEESFDPNTAELGETRIDPNTGETVYYGGKITNEAEAPDLPDPFFLEELQRRDKVKTLEPIGTPIKPKFLKGDFEKVTLKDIEDVLSDQLAPSSNVGQAYAVDTLKSLGFKVDRLKLNAKGTESRAGENYRVKVAGKNVVFKGQDPFSTVINRLNKEHGVNITGSIARRISKAKNFDILNELVLMNGDDLDLKYSEQQGTQSQAFQALQEKLAGNQMANIDYPTNKAFAIQEAKTQELLNDLDKVNTPREFEAVQSRYQDVINNSIYPEYTQEIITPKLEEAQVLLEGFTPLNQAKQDQLKARLERDLNQAQTPEDIARVAEELYSDGTMQKLIDEDSFYESLGTKLQEAEERLNNPSRAEIAEIEAPTSAENAQVEPKGMYSPVKVIKGFNDDGSFQTEYLQGVREVEYMSNEQALPLIKKAMEKQGVTDFEGLEVKRIANEREVPYLIHKEDLQITKKPTPETPSAKPSPTALDDALPPQKGGAETASSGAGSPQARLDGKAQEIGFKNIKHLMQGYKALGGDLTKAKVDKVLAEKPELQAVYDAFKPLTGKTDANGVPKYAEEIEFQQSLLEIARTPHEALDYKNGIGRQQPLKQLQEKNPEGYLSGEDIVKTPEFEMLSNQDKNRVLQTIWLTKQYKSMDVDIATEGGMSGKGGATNAIDGKKRQNITPISFALHNGQIAVNAYNGDGHFAKYYINLDERLVREGKEASRFLSDPIESTAPEFVGTYPNVYRDAIPFLLEDVLNRKPRQEGILTSEARDLLSTARAFKSKLDKEQQLQLKYGANVADLKKIGHELRKLGTPENVVKLTDAIINKAGNKKKLTQNDIIAIKKTLEKDPSLKALKGMCDLFKLSTANLK